jgi:hypothetical protein
MNDSTHDFSQTSSGLSPRDNEDDSSMFFDFGISAPARAEKPQHVANSQTQEPVQRGGIRVSLACVPVSRLRPFCGR